MKKKLWLRILSVLLSIALCVQLGTTIVFAEETADSPEITKESETVKTEPQLVGELTEKRTANEKYFLYDDQTIVAAVYPTAVHYEDEEGALQNIDNTLAESGSEYENGKSLWKVKFAKKAKEGKLVKLKYGSHNIVWSLNGAEKTEAVAISLPEPEDNEDPLMLAGVSSGVLYEDILENTDLEYYLVGDRIKENLILKSADAPDSFLCLTCRHIWTRCRSEASPNINMLTATERRIILSRKAASGSMKTDLVTN